MEIYFPFSYLYNMQNMVKVQQLRTENHWCDEKAQNIGTCQTEGENQYLVIYMQNTLNYNEIRNKQQRPSRLRLWIFNKHYYHSMSRQGCYCFETWYKVQKPKKYKIIHRSSQNLFVFFRRTRWKERKSHFYKKKNKIKAKKVWVRNMKREKWKKSSLN